MVQLLDILPNLWTQGQINGTAAAWRGSDAHLTDPWEGARSVQSHATESKPRRIAHRVYRNRVLSRSAHSYRVRPAACRRMVSFSVLASDFSAFHPQIPPYIGAPTSRTSYVIHHDSGGLGGGAAATTTDSRRPAPVLLSGWPVSCSR